jgi:hypothetical protein
LAYLKRRLSKLHRRANKTVIVCIPYDYPCYSIRN